MATVKRFEDLECWKNARVFVKDIYAFSTIELVKNDFSFQNQIRRAAISIMNNIAEGFGRFSNNEFRRFLDIAAASALEVKSMLYLGFDLSYLNQNDFEKLINQHDKIYHQILALIKYLRTAKVKD